MTLAYSSISDFVTGVSASTGWVNEATDFLGYRSAGVPPVYLSAPLAVGLIVPGVIYLVGSGLPSPYIGGSCLIYLTTNPTSVLVDNPPINTQIGAYTKITGDWTTNFLAHGGFYGTNSNFTVPVTFRGLCTLRATAALIVTAGVGKTGAGLTGSSLSPGSYHVYQDETTLTVFS
jgi:hypothetical protein